jgi:hypothetical protein
VTMQVRVFWSLTAICRCLGRSVSSFRAEEREDTQSGGSGLRQNIGQYLINSMILHFDDSNLQNITKSNSTGRTISLVLPVYIPVVYVPYYIRFSKWNWRLKRDYWLPNYATISACRKADSVQKLSSEININRIWLKEKWRMKLNSKCWLQYCMIELREADHLLSSTAKARTSKLYLHSPIRPHSVIVNQTQDKVTSQCTPGLDR